MKKFIHTPYKSGLGGVKIGLEPINESKWLEIDDSFVPEIQKKQSLFRSKREQVFNQTTKSYQAQVELLEVIKKHLTHYYDNYFRFNKDEIYIKIKGKSLKISEKITNPLEISSFLVQEDLLVMLPNKNQSYNLEAASLCAPSNWSLKEKFNNSLLEVHKHVPDYKENISKRVNNIFNRLEKKRIFERFNWSIYDSPKLFQPKKSKTEVVRIKSINKSNAGEKLFIRVERQTIRRMPKTKAIIFTVRVHVSPLHSIKDDLLKLNDLLLAIKNLDILMKKYKSLDQIERSINGWLEDRINFLGNT